jgi:hypothetical protein
MMKATKQKLPKGWDEKKVRKLIRHYDGQPEAAAVAEDEAAYLSTRVTMMAVPVELVLRVLKMIGTRYN